MKFNLKRQIAEELLKFYLMPFRKIKRLAKYTKDVILLDTEEHIIKPIQFLKILDRFATKPVILDIGGAYGSATELFLSQIPNCVIHIVEANPKLASRLKEKFASRSVFVHNMALSNREGQITFHVADNDLSSSYKGILKNDQFQLKESYDVATQTLDKFIHVNQIQDIDIIKLDVQGAEVDVLAGGLFALKKVKLIIVEQTIRSTYESASKYYEVDDLLRRQNFELLDIITTYRKDGIVLNEFDSIYINNAFNFQLS